MTSIPDHYAALGIDPTADPEVITAAYRALAKKFHPDTGAAAGTASPERFDEIQQAYEVLRTPERRHAYDLELLAATEAELEQHIASKRRVVVRERQRAAEQAADAAAAAPDLGDIRPEPAVPPTARGAARKKPQRSLFPFAIPLVLMMAIGGGAAWLFLPNSPEAPPLPGSKPEDAVTAPKQSAPQAKPAQTAEATPEAAPQPQPQSQPQQQADGGEPLFGSSATDEAPPTIEQAAATPEPLPAPDANSAAKTDKPTFGSSLDSQSPAVAPDAPADAGPQPPPLPKLRPPQPTGQVQQQKPAPRPAATQQQAQLQTRAKLQYQNPPQYNPQPDGYPPPGYPAPGYEPPGYDSPYDPPPGYEDGPPVDGPDGGPYRLVIFERAPGQQATAWSAGVVFRSIGKCTRQGVKAVLRRTADMDPYSDGTRVWYECQQLSQR